MAENPWEAFGQANRPDVTCDFTGSLAADVCEDYGIVCATPDIGGSLDGIDIKHMDSMTVIRLSLLEEGAKSGVFYEPIVNNKGEVEFIKVGSNRPSLDIYHIAQTYTHREECAGVMVTGKKPMAERKPIVWQDLFESAGGKEVYDCEFMTNNCNKPEFSRIAIITYNDPHLSTSYSDGIDNLYEISPENPYDRVLGYAYKITPPDRVVGRDDISISLESTSEVPTPLRTTDFGNDVVFNKPIPDIGVLVKRTVVDVGDQECWTDIGDNAPGGIEIELPDSLRFETIRNTRVDKLLGVNAVYAVGVECVCKGMPRSDADALDNSEGSTDLYIATEDFSSKAYRLDAGIHYVVNYEGTDVTNREVKLVFANNSRINDFAKFGSNVPFKVWPGSKLYQTGVREGNATILPTGGVKGIYVHQIIVILSLDSPCVRVIDPKGEAKSIADDLKIDISPLVMTEEPAPMAKDGELINLVDGIVDHDPTTTQDLQETALERAISEMSSGQGFSLSLSFLDESGVINLSKALFDYMNTGDIVETTYACGPDTRVELGDIGDAGGVINGISYSYSDQGSYMISVNEGPYVTGGLEGITGGPYNKQVESFSAEGTIIQDAGNHIDFKVRVDGLGDRYAINCVPTVLRVGDRVSVSVHNNPVED